MLDGWCRGRPGQAQRAAGRRRRGSHRAAEDWGRGWRGCRARSSVPRFIQVLGKVFKFRRDEPASEAVSGIRRGMAHSYEPFGLEGISMVDGVEVEFDSR